MAKKEARKKQRLKTVQDQFADWRKNRKGRDRIPEPLWNAAASLADGFSINELSESIATKSQFPERAYRNHSTRFVRRNLSSHIYRIPALESANRFD